MRIRSLTLTAALVGMALTAAACTGGTTAQVVGTPATRPPVTTAAPAPAATTPTTTAPSAPPSTSPVSAATLNQLDGELGSLGSSLSQATTDLTQAQGDQ